MPWPTSLLVPLVGLFVVPLALSGCLLSLLGSPLDVPLWQLAAWPLELLLPRAEWLAREHSDLLYLHLAPDFPALLLAVAAVALLAMRGAPGLKAVAACLLLPMLLPPRAGPAPEDGALRVTVLDVGQGTSVLLWQGDRALLYDTGGGDPGGSTIAGSVVLPYLRHIGLRRLDTLVLSHPDTDHSAGAGTLLTNLPVGRVLYSSGAAPRRDARRCRAGAAWRWPGGATLQFMAPAAEDHLPSNEGSCVLRVEYAGHSLLLPGDIGADRERELLRYWGPALGSDWLLAGHHGSDTSSSRSWLKTVRPRYALFSHGYRNRFGHPHPRVIARYRESGVQLLQTATRGALEITLGPGEIQLRGHRDRGRRYWR